MSSLFAYPKKPAAFSIRVEGMAYDSCVERVEKAIRATPGIVSASVNLATKRAEVTFSGVPDIAAVIAAVGVAGDGISGSPHDGMTADAARAYFPRCPKGFAGSIGS